MASLFGVDESFSDAARLVRGASQRFSGASGGREGSTVTGAPGAKEEDCEALKQAAAPPHSVWPTTTTRER